MGRLDVLRKKYMPRVSAALFMPLFLFAAMGSMNYKIQSDSVNFGGNDSQSNAYKVGDTIGEIATGFSESSTYKMHAGFRQMQESYISISAVGDFSLPNVGGLGGGISTTSSAWTVITDSNAGYSLSIRASTNPALQGPLGSSFSDYVPATSDPDFDFTPDPGDSLFGFSPRGTDILQKFKDNGTNTCNTGSSDTDEKCWVGFTTVNQIVSQRSSANHPSGTITTIQYRAEIGASAIQESGQYNATIIVTAVTL